MSIFRGECMYCNYNCFPEFHGEFARCLLPRTSWTDAYKIEISHIWECLPRLSLFATTIARFPHKSSSMPQHDLASKQMEHYPPLSPHKMATSRQFFWAARTDSRFQRLAWIEPNMSELLIGCFRKWWYPQIIQSNRDFHYRSSILGYPYFWKHPIVGNY